MELPTPGTAAGDNSDSGMSRQVCVGWEAGGGIKKKVILGYGAIKNNIVIVYTSWNVWKRGL